MSQAFTDEPRLSAWPFWVLELKPDAANADIEKATRNLVAKLKFGVPDVARFQTPIGEYDRDEYLIREARAQLQDPARRLLAEFWYVDPRVRPAGVDADWPTDADHWYREFGVKLWEA